MRPHLRAAKAVSPQRPLRWDQQQDASENQTMDAKRRIPARNQQHFQSEHPHSSQDRKPKDRRPQNAPADRLANQPASDTQRSDERSQRRAISAPKPATIPDDLLNGPAKSNREHSDEIQRPRQSK